MTTSIPAFDPDSYLESFWGDSSKSADLRRALVEVYEKGLQDAGLRWGEDTRFLARLRAQNLSRLPRFGHGDIKVPHGWGPMQWGCALAGEVGELCNFLKKYQRQMPTDPSPDDLSIEIAAEIADVIIYLDLLSAYFNFDLERLIQTKFNRTSKKFGFPERL